MNDNYIYIYDGKMANDSQKSKATNQKSKNTTKRDGRVVVVVVQCCCSVLMVIWFHLFRCLYFGCQIRVLSDVTDSMVYVVSAVS